MQNETPQFTPLTPQGRHILVPGNKDVKSSDQLRAVSVARAATDHVYNKAAQPQPAQQQNPYNRTHQENFDWRQYHSAWQNYYQQYYQRYYWQQLHTERQKLSAQQASDVAAQPTLQTGANPELTQKTKVAQLKQDITDTVKQQAKKARKSRHFVPIASALGVGIAFLFLQFNSVVFAQVRSYVSPGDLSNDSLIVDPTANPNVGPEPKLIIPKINVEVPVDYSVTGLTENQIQTSLRDGATHYNLPGADAVPGQYGNTVILGHSSNDVFNQGKYKFVFVLLDRVQAGDTFYLNYNSKRYIYKVTKTQVIDPTQVSALQIGTDKAMATLVTCTPPGTALKRLLIFGEQISPDPSGAAPATQPQQSTQNAQKTTIPGNEPSWLDNIWNFFF
ncbi:MAG TPA: sortase [Candidatus Saccharimonas sp.]|nr:sortase [Candidatus Saccharimonas sp.]